MKLWLLPLSLVAGAAIACPADGAKDAMAPTDAPAAAVAAAKAPVKAVKATQADTMRVAQKATEPRKTQ